MGLPETSKSIFLLSSISNAFQINNFITSSHPLVTEDVLEEFRLNLLPINAEKTIFGFTVPFIPIQINSTDLLADSEKEKVSRLLDLHTHLVELLCKWVGVAYSLRYIYDPVDRSIKVVILCRVTHQPGKTSEIATEVAYDIERTITSVLHFPVKRINSKVELEKVLLPFSDLYTCEIWQYEQPVDVTERTEIGEEFLHPINVICPFKKPANSTWLNTFKRITMENDPVIVNIHIEPTYLYPFEELKLQEAAKVINSFVTYKIIRNQYTREVQDPINRAVANSFTRRWKQLSGSNNPVLQVIQVTSSNQATAYEIAKTLASDITESVKFEDSTSNETLVPSGYSISVCRNEDQSAALRTLTSLDIFPRSVINMETRGRSRFLTDIESASAAFRFPVSLANGIPGIPTKPILESIEFQSQENPNSALLGEVVGSPSKAISIPLENFPRHILIAGTVGSGKTYTCLQMLGELWKKEIPWLVIEPVKAHYRTLLKDNDPYLSENIQVFTLGKEGISPFRLNPFELLPGVTVEEHITQLAKCFQSAIPQFQVLPMIIQDSLYNIYFSHGWQLSDTYEIGDQRSFPTLSNFYIECIIVAENGGWSQSVTQDITGAVSMRIGSLLKGSKGMMLNTSLSIPFWKIMEKPTILELNSLNNDERALVMMFLLVFIREYAVTRQKKGILSHVTVIEEAHRIMSTNNQAQNLEIAPDIGGSTMKDLSEFLSEIRALGEGVIIADQIPSRLIEDAHKNSNTKIIHTLPGKDDRELIGNTINASVKQINDVSLLENGQAAFFTSGMYGPTFIQVRNYPKDHCLPIELPDNEVRNHMQKFVSETNNLLPFQGCLFCEAKCSYRERIGTKVYNIQLAKAFRKYSEESSIHGFIAAHWISAIEEIKKSLAPIRLDKNFDAVYCFLVHLVDIQISRDDHEKLKWKFNISNKNGPSL